jgi:hypothetical protein
METPNSPDGFVIDATFLFEASNRVTVGAPLLFVDGKDCTFLFCAIRDLLRLRRTLGIQRGVAVVGEDAHHAAGESNVKEAVAFLRALGVPVIYEGNRRVLDICAKLGPCATCFVTRNLNLLHLAESERTVILLKGKKDVAVFDSAAVTSSVGVGPACIPALLALTEGPPLTVVTRRQAVSLLQRHPSLSRVLEDPSVVASRQVRHILREHKALFAERLGRFTPSTLGEATNLVLEKSVFDIDNECSSELLRAHQFHSLVRLLPALPPEPAGRVSAARPSPCYQAVTTPDAIRSLVARLASAAICAVDTESSGKDPHQAELFGVAFSMKSGEAFYLPVVAEDLEGAVDRDLVLGAIRDIISSGTKFVGHNLKYDYVLLRRHQCEISNFHFDTMLAAHECFGDWGLLNLPFVANRLLGREVKSYKDIVSEGQTFLDVPFKELLLHACEDADTTFQLYHVLEQELGRRGLLNQYTAETLPLGMTLGKWEVEGVPVDAAELAHLRGDLLVAVNEARRVATDCAGASFDLDTEEDVRRVLRRDRTMVDLIGSGRASSRLLEELGICHPLPRAIVKFRRVQKQLRQVEEVLRSVENGRVHPVFSQTSNSYGQLTTIKPRLFEELGPGRLSDCFFHPMTGQFRSSGRSLNVIQDLSGDALLKRDRQVAAGSGRFLLNGVSLPDVDHEDLLLSMMIGMSNSKLCRRFFCDRSAMESIRHDVELRYAGMFKWLATYREETIRRGFALDGNRKRCLAGLRSSDLGKRQDALDSAVRWLLRY